MARLPTDEQLWGCMSQTLRSVVLPCVEDPWARIALIRLIGLAEYAPVRGADPTPARVAELVDCIDNLVSRHPDLSNSLPDAWPSEDPKIVLDACGRLLANAVEQDTPAAQSVRTELRSIVVTHLDDELSVTGPLIAAFGGQLSDE
jgi:hypothetical protein